MLRRTFLAGMASLPSLLSGSPRVLEIGQLSASTASLSGMTFEQSLAKIRELGFGGVDIITSVGNKHSIGPIPGAVVAEMSEEERRRCRAAVGRFKHVSTHLPFVGLRPLAADPALRKAARDQLHRAIDDSGFWGASVAAVHAPSEPGKTYAELRGELIDLFHELGEHAAKVKLRLGIETMQPNRIKDYLALIRDVNHDFVGGLVDVGHIGYYRADLQVADADRATPKGVRRYNDLLLEVVQELGPKLLHFHVHDVRPSDWRDHRTIGSGLIDWARLLGYLSKIGYPGALVIELEESPPIDALVESRLFFERTIRSL